LGNAALDDELVVEEEEADQQPPNPPPSHSDALQHVHSLMQFAGTNLPHLQPTFINIYSEVKRTWATDNIKSIFYYSEIKQKSVVHVDQW
jgi:hypothetical protein